MIVTSLASLSNPLHTTTNLNMAKGSRASTIKANNAKLKSGVFGPIETERTARLSAKLLELASQPKPVPRTRKEDVDMDSAGTCLSSSYHRAPSLPFQNLQKPMLKAQLEIPKQQRVRHFPFARTIEYNTY